MRSSRLKRQLNKAAKNKHDEHIEPTFPKTHQEALKHEYSFWSKQPVLQLNDKNMNISCQLKQNVVHVELSLPELSLPEQCCWFDLDINSDSEKICAFLNEHDVTVCKKFKQVYTENYIKWKFKNAKIVSIKDNDGIVGIIFGIPRTYQIFNKTTELIEAANMCIHPKYRKSSMASVLMSELIKKCSDKYSVGLYATEYYTPTPFLRVEYYHRPLNCDKLVKNQFRYYTVPSDQDNYVKIDKNKLSKPIAPTEYKKAYELLCKYQDRYNVYRKYTFDEFVELISDPELVVCCGFYETDNLVDIFCYHKRVFASGENNITDALVILYTSNKITPLTIFKNITQCAYLDKCDILTCTDNLENTEIIFDNYSKITSGADYKYYNFYNWNCPDVSSQQVFSVLV